eukprot:1161921-Pelagomonas_calceolata.AAC.5
MLLLAQVLALLQPLAPRAPRQQPPQLRLLLIRHPQHPARYVQLDGFQLLGQLLLAEGRCLCSASGVQMLMSSALRSMNGLKVLGQLLLAEGRCLCSASLVQVYVESVVPHESWLSGTASSPTGAVDNRKVLHNRQVLHDPQEQQEQFVGADIQSSRDSCNPLVLHNNTQAQQKHPGGAAHKAQQQKQSSKPPPFQVLTHLLLLLRANPLPLPPFLLLLPLPPLLLLFLQRICQVVQGLGHGLHGRVWQLLRPRPPRLSWQHVLHAHACWVGV